MVASNEIRLISKGNTIKQGDTVNSFLVKLIDAEDAEVNLTNCVVTWKLADSRGVILEREIIPTNVEKGELLLELTREDEVSIGDLRTEIRVDDATGGTQKFPSNGWFRFTVTETLDNLEYTPVAVKTVQYFFDELLSVETDHADIKQAVTDHAYNVNLEFGAKGDDEFDNTQALQDALDFALDRAALGLTTNLYFPDPIYRISGTLLYKRNVDGNIRLHMFGNNNSTGTVIKQMDETKYCLDIGTTSGNLRGFRVTDIGFQNSFGTCWKMTRCQYNWFTNVGFRISGKAIENVSSGFNTFIGSWFYYLYETLITFSENSHLWGQTRFIGCKMGEEMKGIIPGGSCDVSFENCHFHWILGLNLPLDDDPNQERLLMFNLDQNSPVRVNISNCRFDMVRDECNTFMYTNYGAQTVTVSNSTFVLKDGDTVFLNRYQHVGYFTYRPKVVTGNLFDFSEGSGWLYDRLEKSEYNTILNWNNSIVSNNAIIVKNPDETGANGGQLLLDESVLEKAHNNSFENNKVNIDGHSLNKSGDELRVYASNPANTKIGEMWIRSDVDPLIESPIKVKMPDGTVKNINIT